MEYAPSARLQDLLDRHRAGDSVAREALLENSQGRLELLARKMFRKEADLRAFDETGDVLNKAMLRLHKALDKVRPETVRAYLAIAANQIRWVLKDLAREHGGTAGHLPRGGAGTGGP